MKETLKPIKKHFIESFTEFFESVGKIFADPNLLEKFFVWCMTIFTVCFGVTALVVPIILHTNADVSGFVYLSYIITIPILVVLIAASANWIVKVCK